MPLVGKGVVSVYSTHQAGQPHGNARLKPPFDAQLMKLREDIAGLDSGYHPVPSLPCLCTTLRKRKREAFIRSTLYQNQPCKSCRVISPRQS